MLLYENELIKQRILTILTGEFEFKYEPDKIYCIIISLPYLHKDSSLQNYHTLHDCRTFKIFYCYLNSIDPFSHDYSSVTLKRKESMLPLSS